MTSHLARVELFTLKSAATGREYEISIAPPPHAPDGSAPTDCPIVFIPDALISFGTAVDVVTYQSGLAGGEAAVVVGVGYGGDISGMVQARTLDLTPQPDPDLPPMMAGLIGAEQGGADAFLDFLTGELADEVCRRVPAASRTRRILFGHSLGGLLAIHALFTRPEAFESFCASSPALWWANFAVLEFRDGLDARIAAAGVRPKVYISAGALEQTPSPFAPPGWELEELNARLAKCRMVDAAVELAQSLETAPLKALHHVIFTDETHTSTLPAALSRALNFALTPKA